MSTLSVPRSLTDNTNPTETQFDTMRTYLLNFFNNTNLDENNVASGSMVWTSLGDLADDAALKFTSSYGTMKYVSASTYLEVKNTQGSIIWGVRSGATLTNIAELANTGTLTLAGIPSFNTSVGAQTASLLYLLSSYRKPRLTYTSSDIITCETNYDTSSILMGRDRLLVCQDTTMSLAVTAVGAKNTDVGSAVSGLANGLTRTANRWYFIYGVEVQYGTHNDGTKFILIAHTTSPAIANIATLNTAFGTGKWTYMGCIRNGYNDGTNTNIVVPFMMDSSGFTTFTQGTVNEEGMGITMASTTGASNLEYTIVIGNAADATVPDVATRVLWGGHRENLGHEMHYRDIATDENHMIVSSCIHQAGYTTLTPALHFEVPLLEDYKIVINIGSTSTDQRITVVGFMDHYV